MPHETRDPVVAAVAIAQAFQTIVSRNHYAMDDLVVSVTQIHTGTTDNVIPETAYLNGTVRTFDPKVQQMVIDRMKTIVAGQALSFGVAAELDYEVGYPATVNDADKTRSRWRWRKRWPARPRCRARLGARWGRRIRLYAAEAPRCYLFIGQGDGAGLHQPTYDSTTRSRRSARRSLPGWWNAPSRWRRNREGPPWA